MTSTFIENQIRVNASFLESQYEEIRDNIGDKVSITLGGRKKGDTTLHIITKRPWK